MTEDEAKRYWIKHRDKIMACMELEGQSGYLPYIIAFANADGTGFRFHAPGFKGLTPLLLIGLLDDCQQALLTSKKVAITVMDPKEDK